MIGVNVHTMYVELYVFGTPTEKKHSAQDIAAIIFPRDREYISSGKWKVRNPWKYAEKIPAIKSALEDSQKQMSLFSAKELASTQDQKYAEFFFYLTLEEQMIIIECAYQALRDELTDGFMRENGLLDIDTSDEYLQPIYDKLDKFLGAE